MLSDDFAYVWEKERKWEDWYYEEIVNNEMYKTLVIIYKGRFYQYEPVGGQKNEHYKGRPIRDDSYIFFSFPNMEKCVEGYDNAVCYDSFKQAVDEAEIVPGKTLKDIWYDPESEYWDFL